MSEQEAQDGPVSVADEAGIAFDDALARQESKPINGKATPQQVGYFEAGFNAGAEWQRGRVSPVTREDAITIPRPHVPYGPIGVPERVADADYLREAAKHIEGGFKVGGSNLSATVIKMLRDSADALVPVSPPAEVAEDDERIIAWERVAVHEAFNSCYGKNRPLIESVVSRLNDLVEMEQTVNELTPTSPAEVEWEYGVRWAGEDNWSAFLSRSAAVAAAWTEHGDSVVQRTKPQSTPAGPWLPVTPGEGKG